MTSQRRADWTYHIDEDDRIVFVCPDWMTFARENQAPELTPDRVLGASVHDFIADPETRYLYRMLFHAAHSERKEITVPFRCDSPAVRRFVELTIMPLVRDELRPAVRLVSQEPRAHAAMLDRDAPRSREWLRICSWCKRVKDEEQGWIEPEDAIRRMDLFGTPRLPQLTHGIRPRCKADMLETIHAHPAQTSAQAPDDTRM